MKEEERINIIAEQNSNFELDNDNENMIEPNLYIYKTLSFISWIYLIYSSFKIFREQNMTYFLLELLNKETIYITKIDFYAYPMLIRLRLLHTFISVLIIIGFITYVIYTIIKPMKSIEEAMFGKVSKLHFIPLFLVSTVFMMMENINPIEKEKKTTEQGEIYYECPKANLSMNMITIIIMICFTFLALVFLIIIYFKTNFNNNNLLASYTIKKGVYSPLIVLMLHHVFNCIIAIKYIDILHYTYSQESKRYDFFILARSVMSIIFGCAIFIFSFVFKDVMALFINVLIYIGMLINLRIVRWNSTLKYEEGYFMDLIIDICMLSISFIGLFFFSCKKLDEKLLL